MAYMSLWMGAAAAGAVLIIVVQDQPSRSWCPPLVGAVRAERGHVEA
ncbi:MAG TPA: hypothetical protein VMC78_00895 [Mycobacterium sp.]|nr:hypothetical protein [Mycobacterium sp.]